MEEEMKRSIGISYIGTISLKDNVYITDPCYDMDVWCNEYLDNVLPGSYKCFANVVDKEDWGLRFSELIIVNEEFLKRRNGDLESIHYNNKAFSNRIGVDSGQCGIFDADYYKKNQPDNNYDNKESFYRRCCDISLNGGTIDNLGVVTASGYGDGLYSLYTARSGKKTAAMKIVFITEYDDAYDRNGEPIYYGDNVIWYDPDEEHRDLSVVYKVTGIKGDILTISNKYSEAEVYPNELEVV